MTCILGTSKERVSVPDGGDRAAQPRLFRRDNWTDPRNHNLQLLVPNTRDPVAVVYGKIVASTQPAPSPAQNVVGWPSVSLPDFFPSIARRPPPFRTLISPPQSLRFPSRCTTLEALLPRNSLGPSLNSPQAPLLPLLLPSRKVSRRSDREWLARAPQTNSVPRAYCVLSRTLLHSLSLSPQPSDIATLRLCRLPVSSKGRTQERLVF